MVGSAGMPHPPEALMQKLPDPSAQPVSRRRLFAGAGAAGALAATAALLPQAEQAPAALAQAKRAPQAGGGYQLTAHVQRYYQTAKV